MHENLCTLIRAMKKILEHSIQSREFSYSTVLHTNEQGEELTNKDQVLTEITFNFLV